MPSNIVNSKVVEKKHIVVNEVKDSEVCKVKLGINVKNLKVLMLIVYVKIEIFKKLVNFIKDSGVLLNYSINDDDTNNYAKKSKKEEG